MKRRFFLLLGLAVLFAAKSFALDPWDYAVDVTCQAQVSPPALVFSWPQTDQARQYWIRRKKEGDSSWSNPIATLPPDSTGFTDTQVSVGSAWEYEIQMETTEPAYEGGWISAYSYIYGGIQVPVSDFKGKALLVVDNTIAGDIAAELDQFSKDLVAAGYLVVQRTVDRNAPVTDVKNVIRDEYNADPGNFRSIILIGHVPVPYSGDIDPDLHDSHKGAWPADVYYADMDGTWTDDSVSITSEDYPQNDNFPGDGKFDQSQIPAFIRLEIGRIDFADMPAFAPRSETDLLKNYFQKDHAFRNRLFTAPRRGLVRDNFGDLDGDAPAVDAWRHFSGFFGSGNAQEVPPDTFFPTLNSEAFLWAYGCGGGSPYKADGVGSTSDFAAGNPQAVFYILHGSYFGDWNMTDNFIRAALGSQNMGLESIWSGIPHWYLHHMALGKSIGYSTRITQNNITTYKSYRNFDPGEVHIALMGDPTLEMFPVIPPANLTASEGSGVVLNWAASSDENIAGYHVYYSSNPNGPFARITSDPIGGTSYTHSGLPAGTYYYMVRAIKLERTGSGTFFNASQGVLTSITTGGSPVEQLPTVTVTFTDSTASEDGPDNATFEVRRDSPGSNPLAVNYLIGGTARNGVDYVEIPATITIPAGSTSAAMAITPIADSLSEGNETVTIQIALSSSYKAGTPQAAFLIIEDSPATVPPVIEAIPNQTRRKNSGTDVLTVQIKDPSHDVNTVVASAASSNISLVPNENMTWGGAGESRTLSITPAPGATGSSTITVTVSDDLADAKSSFIFAVTNSFPYAADDDVFAVTGVVHIPFTAILSNDLDPDGDALTPLLSSNASTLGGTVQALADEFIYTPPNNGGSVAVGTDSFDYQIQDTSGAIASAVVHVHLSGRPVIEARIDPASGTVTLAISGPPYGRFRVERSIDAVQWQAAGEGDADANGKAEFRDTENGSRMKFYRAEWLSPQ